MAAHSLTVTLQIRRDSANDWTTRNPILLEGEYGLETDTHLIKIGDGVRDWAHLPYLNKLDTDYFTQSEDGSLTISQNFINTISILEAAAGQAISHLTITDQPINDTDAANKKYVDDSIAASGHLKREVVQTLPPAIEADPDTLYMILATSGDHYEEYMVINGIWDLVGTTGDGGSGGTFTLDVATEARLGGVKASSHADRINVTQEGFMTLNQVSTSKLYIPTGDTLVLYGGTA